MAILKTNPSTVAEQQATPFGTYHLADNPNLYEVQRSNNFELVVSGLDNLQRAGSLGTEENAFFSNAQEVLRLSVSSAPVPHFTQSVISVRRGNSELKYAGVPTFNAGTIVVNDYIGAETKDILIAWQALSYNVRTEKVGLSSDYKKLATLVEMSPDGQVVRKWKLHGCWVSGISEDAYNSENNDKKTMSVTIEYDRAEIDLDELV